MPSARWLSRQGLSRQGLSKQGFGRLLHNGGMTDREVNFARAIIGERNYRDVPADEVLREAERLLGEWMAGELRMERPKLYDHYALLLLALLQKNRELESRLAALEAKHG